MYTIGAFLAPLIMAPFITLANQNVSTGKHPFSRTIFGTNSFHDVKKETPCKNVTETKPNNINFEDLDDDGNFYIFLGNILFQLRCLKFKL